MRKMMLPHGGYLNVLEKGDRLNPYGRPRSILSILKKERGYHDDEIDRLSRIFPKFTESDLKKIENDETYSVLERVFAKVMLKALYKATLKQLEVMLLKFADRKAKSIIELETSPEILSLISEKTNDPIKAARAYMDLMKASKEEMVKKKQEMKK